MHKLAEVRDFNAVRCAQQNISSNEVDTPICGHEAYRGFWNSVGRAVIQPLLVCCVLSASLVCMLYIYFLKEIAVIMGLGCTYPQRLVLTLLGMKLILWLLQQQLLVSQ